jgi:hypothetical protein
MSITLPAKWVDHLTHLPESGMGWQRVDVELADGRRLENCVVRNAEILDVTEPVDAAQIRGISIHTAAVR